MVRMQVHDEYNPRGKGGLSVLTNASSAGSNQMTNDFAHPSGLFSEVRLWGNRRATHSAEANPGGI